MILLLLLLENFQRSDVPPMCSRFILLFVDAGISLVLLLLEKGNGSNFKLAYVHYIQNGKNPNGSEHDDDDDSLLTGHAGQFVGCRRR